MVPRWRLREDRDKMSQKWCVCEFIQDEIVICNQEPETTCFESEAINEVQGLAQITPLFISKSSITKS